MYVQLMWPSRLQEGGVQAHDSHPIFFKGSGKSYTSLGQQAAVLRCAVAGVPVTSVPVILDMDDKHALARNMSASRRRRSSSAPAMLGLMWKMMKLTLGRKLI